MLRKQVRGKVGPISRKKRAPKEYPIEPELVEFLKWHRRRLLEEQAPRLAIAGVNSSGPTGASRASQRDAGGGTAGGTTTAPETRKKPTA